MSKYSEIGQEIKEGIMGAMRRLDEENKEEVENYKKGLEGSTDGFWVCYPNKDYEYYSPKFKEELGFNEIEFLNHPSSWIRQILPEDLEVAMANFQKHIDTKGEHPYKQLVRYRCKDGSIKKFICRGSIVDWNEMVMIGTHVNVTNI